MNENGMLAKFVASLRRELAGTTEMVTGGEKIAFSGPVISIAVTCCGPSEVSGNTTEKV
jgi:hypothetical protein